MPRIPALAMLSTLMVAPGPVGCGHQREDALAEVDKIERACLSGNPDRARELLLKATENNREFERAFSYSTASIQDRSRVNACGLILTELRKNLRRR